MGWANRKGGASIHASAPAPVSVSRSGVQFTSIAAPQVEQIRKYVERRLAEGGEAD